MTFLPNPEKHRIALNLSPDTQTRFRELLETGVRPHLSPDVSNYARGRVRCWLRWEAPLSARQSYKPGLVVPELWTGISRTWQRSGLPGVPDLALAIYGDIGIRPHRDASYAKAMALSINLGRTTWGWTPQRESNRDEDLVWFPMTGGEVTVFDAKHRHAARDVAADRWAIIAWQTKPTALPEPPAA